MCFVATIGVGLSLSSMYPSAITMAQGRFSATGWQTSIFVGGAPLGGIMWPSIVGALMRVFSALAMPWTTLVLAGLATLSFCGVMAVGQLGEVASDLENAATTACSVEMKSVDLDVATASETAAETKC